MQRDRGRSSTDRREAAILRAWRVGNSLAAMRAGKRHAGRTHKSRHMQNEARCISHNSPNELLSRRPACRIQGTYVATLSHMCALHNTRCCTWCSHKAGGAVASFTVYQLHNLVSSTSSISVSGVRPSPGRFLGYLMIRVPSLTLQLCRSLVYLWQPDSNAFQQEASRSAQRLRGTCCWGAQGAARDPPPSHSSRTIRSSTLDAIRFIRVARRSPTGV